MERRIRLRVRLESLTYGVKVDTAPVMMKSINPAFIAEVRL